MSIFEYNEEDVRQVLREEALEEGYEEGYKTGRTDGKIEALLYLLEEKGIISEDLDKRIKTETDENTLRKWLKLASSAESIEKFKRSCSTDAILYGEKA